MWTTWWIWLVGAAVLGLLELVAPAFVLLGFAVGATVTGLLLIGGPTAVWLSGSFPMTLLVFSVLSLVSWLVLRKIFRRSSGSVQTFEHDIND